MAGDPKILHPTLSAAERRRLLWEGIERFNAGQFFESHESWEEIWRSTSPEPRDFFQGLVQVAAGLHHALDRDRPEPARRVLAKGRRRLEPLAPLCLGLDLEDLLRSVRSWEEWLGGSHEEGDREAPEVPRIRVVDPEAAA